MFRSLGTVPAHIFASALLMASFCSGQTATPPATPPTVVPGSAAGPIIVGDAGPVVVGEKPGEEKPDAAARVAPDLASRPDPKVPEPKGAPADQRPVPARDASAAYASTGKPYVIGSLDVLDIRVWNAPNLSGFFDVGPDGTISLPLLGEIRCDGLTKEDLTRLIRDRLASTVFTEAPEVNVQVARVNSKKYYMFGEVNRPGEFPLLGPMTVLDAFANAGGFHDFANKKAIYILRGDQKIKFNYNDVSHGKHMEQNIQLQNGDRIFIP